MKKLTKLRSGRTTLIKIYGFPLLFAMALLSISGCAALGAKRMPGDRFDYNAAIGQSSREQMLMNIVRLRYLEMPIFTTVSSVVTQYDYTGGIGDLGGIRESTNSGSVTNTIAGTANLSYTEAPTITYLPVGGQEFSAHLMSDVPAETLFIAAREGWASDVLMRIGLQRFGAVENSPFGDFSLRPDYALSRAKLEKFTYMVNLFSILNNNEMMEFEKVGGDAKTGTGAKHYLTISKDVPANLRPMVAEFRQLVGFGNRNRLRITDKIANVGGDEISIQTRSVMAMMEFLARGVEVPVEHLEKGWVTDFGLQSGGGNIPEDLFPFSMHSSKNRPDDAFAAVRYQDYWYYIKRDDLASKQSLHLITVMYQLKAPATTGAAPVLTL